MRKSDRERKTRGQFADRQQVFGKTRDNKNIQKFKIGIGRERASVSIRRRSTISHYYAVLTMIGFNLVQLRRVRCQVSRNTGINEPIGLWTIKERTGCVESFSKLCRRFGSFITTPTTISSVVLSLVDLTSMGIGAPFTTFMTMAFIVAVVRTTRLGVATTPRWRKWIFGGSKSSRGNREGGPEWLLEDLKAFDYGNQVFESW